MNIFFPNGREKRYNLRNMRRTSFSFLRRHDKSSFVHHSDCIVNIMKTTETYKMRNRLCIKRLFIHLGNVI